jgi:hypothetical protein
MMMNVKFWVVLCHFGLWRQKCEGFAVFLCYPSAAESQPCLRFFLLLQLKLMTLTIFRLIFRRVSLITELSEISFLRINIFYFGNLLNNSTVPHSGKLGTFRILFAKRPIIVLIRR